MGMFLWQNVGVQENNQTSSSVCITCTDIILSKTKVKGQENVPHSPQDYDEDVDVLQNYRG